MDDFSALMWTYFPPSSFSDGPFFVAVFFLVDLFSVGHYSVDIFSVDVICVDLISYNRRRYTDVPEVCRRQVTYLTSSQLSEL